MDGYWRCDTSVNFRKYFLGHLIAERGSFKKSIYNGDWEDMDVEILLKQLAWFWIFEIFNCGDSNNNVLDLFQFKHIFLFTLRGHFTAHRHILERH